MAMLMRRGLAQVFVGGCLIFSTTGTSPAQAEDYQSIRRMVSTMYDEGALEVSVVGTDSGVIYLVDDCATGVSDFEESEHFFLSEIAVEVERIRRILASEGFPESEWAARVDRHEEAAVEIARRSVEAQQFWDDSGELASGLISELASTLGTSPTSGQRLAGEVGGLCGGGGIEATLVSNPEGARIWLLPEFDFRLCGKSWDVEGCRWRERTGETVSVVSGTYRVFAKWPDGDSSKSTRDFLQESTDLEFTVEISK